MSSKRSLLIVALVLFVAALAVAPAQPAKAQGSGWLVADIRVKCASGALPPQQPWTAYFKRANGITTTVWANYNGVYNGERVYIGSYYAVADLYQNRVSRPGYDSGWAGWKTLSSGGSATWTWVHVMGC